MSVYVGESLLEWGCTFVNAAAAVAEWVSATAISVVVPMHGTINVCVTGVTGVARLYLETQRRTKWTADMDWVFPPRHLTSTAAGTHDAIHDT